MSSLIHNPLQIYCKQLLQQFTQSKNTKNPALFLYANNARTPLFMAESITRILTSLNANTLYEKWHKVFKKLEDSFGEIDVYDAALKQFSKNKLVKIEQLNYFTKKRDKLILKLNEKLVEKDFYFTVFSQINNSKELNFNHKIIITQIKKHIQKELQNTLEFFNQFPKEFDNMELQVHELRRKLRWVSIYAQSLQGIIVLKNERHTERSRSAKYTWEKQFITPTEKTSPFNKLPVAKKLTDYIYFNQKAFYALSNIINNLGKIKDKGLSLELLQKSFRKTMPLTKENSAMLAAKQIQLNHTEDELLKEAHQLLELFYKKYSIHQLLIL